LKNLMEAELAKNDQLHTGLRQLVILRRYALLDADQVENYLPTKLDIEAGIDRLNNGRLYKKVRTLPEFLRKLRKTRDLKKFLKGEVSRRSWLSFGKKKTSDLVAENIDLLLVSKRRSKRFFRVLKDYLADNYIFLTQTQERTLSKNLR